MRRWNPLILLLTGISVWAVLFVGALLLRPFASQSAGDLETALTIRAWAPWVTSIVLLLAIWPLTVVWRQRKAWLGKVVATFGFLLLASGAWMARQNHFEWMFNPIETMAFAVAEEADFLADTEMVIGVSFSGEAKAYSRDLLAYHHLVNDVVGGQPLVATY